ncbi:MAG: hypothetical protein KC502_20295 [Myxococcales bacterium]|nr:hypothetical protein [Myxococcales bacterium]
MRLTCPACDHVFELPALQGSPRRVRCASCAETLSVREHESGMMQVQVLATVPDGPPTALSAAAETMIQSGAVLPPTVVSMDAVEPPATQMATADEFGPEARGRKRTVMEGPSAREQISDVHVAEPVPQAMPGVGGGAAAMPEAATAMLDGAQVTAALSPDAATQAVDTGASKPAGLPAARRGPQIILRHDVKKRVEVHDNPTHVYDTVREMEAVAEPPAPITVPDAVVGAPEPAPQRSPQQPQPDPVVMSPTWSPAVDTELTYDSTSAKVKPKRRWPIVLIGLALFSLLVAVGVGGWLLLSFSESPEDSARQVESSQPKSKVAEPGAADKALADKRADDEKADDKKADDEEPEDEAPRPKAMKRAAAMARPTPARLAGQRDKPASDEKPPSDEKPAQDAGDNPKLGGSLAEKAVPVEPELDEPEEQAMEDDPQARVAAAKPTARAKPTAPVFAATHEVFNTSGDDEAPWLALRSRPHHRSKLLSEMSDDTQLRKVGSRGKWWKVRIVGGEDDGVVGWANRRWIRRSAP